MVRIRLRRVGAKKQPSYRVVVADSRSPRDGRFIETIGYYNPRTDPPTAEIKEDRALYWLSQGAQPSKAVSNLLERQGTMERLARLVKGESLDALLDEAARAQQQITEEAPSPKRQTKAAATAEVTETEVVEAQADAKEVVSADAPANLEATESVAEA